MPDRKKNTDKWFDYDRIRVEVRGSSISELRNQALRLAAEYFEVDVEHAALEALPFLAEPDMFGADNTPVRWSATLTVAYDPHPGVPDGEEPASAGSSSHNFGSGSVPPRSGRLTGPVGVEQWSEDDDSDEDEDDDDDEA